LIWSEWMTTTGQRPAAAGDREAVGRIIADLRSVLREIRCIGSERLVRRGISMGHLHLMSVLDRHGDMAMSRLAEVLDVSLSNVTGLIDRMEERGLVARRRVPDDRRVVLVELTDDGRRALADLELLRNDLLARILAHLDEQQLARVAAALDDLRGAVGDTIRDEPDLLQHVHGHHAPATT
jgi:DNA-binding MarR family transcriptional regulator